VGSSWWRSSISSPVVGVRDRCPTLARYVCVRCGKDWTTDLENFADSPDASLDALCECDKLIVAEGAKPGVFLIEGLVAKQE
jgi:hypothetical protein